MRTHVKVLTGLALLLVGLPTAAAAQTGPELGMDARLDVQLADGGDLTVLQVPAARFRAGFPMSERVAIEPAASITWANGDGETFRSVFADLSLLLHLATDPTRSRGYVRAGGIVEHVSAGDSDTQLGVGGGVGVKVPVGSQLGIRFEATAARLFESDFFPAHSRVGGLVGISVFTG